MATNLRSLFLGCVALVVSACAPMAKPNDEATPSPAEETATPDTGVASPTPAVDTTATPGVGPTDPPEATATPAPTQEPEATPTATPEPEVTPTPVPPTMYPLNISGMVDTKSAQCWVGETADYQEGYMPPETSTSGTPQYPAGWVGVLPLVLGFEGDKVYAACMDSAAALFGKTTGSDYVRIECPDNYGWNGAGNCGYYLYTGSPPEGDFDGDSWTTGEGDCDDSRRDTFPGAYEACDGVDNNCNGQTDEAQEGGDSRCNVK